MSSEDTRTKFDFTDTQFCRRCDKFDPENDIPIKGEENEVDSESD
jgi:hypothetical protein